MLNEDMERALQQLSDHINDSRTSPRWRKVLGKIMDDTINARRGYDFKIEELEMLLLRNPAFPGDMMGVWDDNIPDDETLDEEDDG